MKKQGERSITVVGGGLAGCECALQLASFGHSVVLHEMRPQLTTPAHRTEQLAELVCSNSFGSLSPLSAPGQLKWEAREMGSFILRAAEKTRVPAGQALGLDREQFARQITQWVEQHPRIEIRRSLVSSLEEIPRPAVIATGPLTHEALAKSLQNHLDSVGGEAATGVANFLYFFDAIAPIVAADSIDYSVAWRADRYDKGTPDYLNCPLDKDEYLRLVEEIGNGRKVEAKAFESTPFFESCLPIEVMVERGPQTLRFGPLKPVGLRDPRTGRVPYAVVQLRAENLDRTCYNLVGFQTRLAYGEQTRIFRQIPGLALAEFLKLGSMHRNLFVNSPARLSADLSSRRDPLLFFAGQITGVEGYFESTCTGLLVARFLHQKLTDQKVLFPPRETAMGSLLHAISDPLRAPHFQPTNINFGLFPPARDDIKDKTLRKELQIERARNAMSTFLSAGGEKLSPSPLNLHNL
ncbi:MAG: methylenetetrahydrofolate--tRNA-(uracil(54)-C(5))-methyltransferase (FADH(2)-oxidizing) TrmFO [Bdellovibrio sp.]|nr:MAG: methylenetetrahydrofolate--tRNA-(uracil(54)-C(5))-methyltransferase (FADH(2)-oxidizing) TrmFO [Bdellovibrio sp.]